MRVVTAVLCEGIRVEESKKYILIGVYPENILAKAFPTQLSLSLWVQMYIDRNGEILFDFRVLYNKKQIMKGEAGAEVGNYKEIITLPITPIRINAEAEGTLSFQFREKGQRWKTIKTVEIIKKPT